MGEITIAIKIINGKVRSKCSNRIATSTELAQSISLLELIKNHQLKSFKDLGGINETN